MKKYFRNVAIRFLSYLLAKLQADSAEIIAASVEQPNREAEVLCRCGRVSTPVESCHMCRLRNN